MVTNPVAPRLIVPPAIEVGTPKLLLVACTVPNTLLVVTLLKVEISTIPRVTVVDPV